MIKKVLSILLALLLAFMFTNPVSAMEIVFTHPELGEMLTFQMENGMVRFQIYGFTYYEIVDPQTPVRGMTVNQPNLIHDQMPLLDKSINLLLDSVEGKNGDNVPVQFSYTGGTEPYSKSLELLNREEKVEAIQLLNGFEGPEGYSSLKNVPGFENEDFSSLARDHETFTVRVGNKRYEYRVLQFFIDEDAAERYYFERYCYLKLDSVWRLARITREYTDMLEDREFYHHGLEGSWTGAAYDVHYELMQDLEWGMPVEDVLNLDGAVKTDEGVSIPDIEVFKVPCSINFSFTEGKLSGIDYILKSDLSYYSAFISLYMRYADPVTFDEYGNSSWSLNDSVIQLLYDQQSPVISVIHDEYSS